MSADETVKPTTYPSFLEDALRHNCPLSEEETSIVIRCRTEAEQLAQRIKQETNENKAATAWRKLFRIKTPPTKWRLVCNTVLAPVRSLPVEIIQEIAIHCLPEHPSGSRRNVPVSMSQVSSAWRNAVISQPKLWSVLSIEVEYSASLVRCASAINAWFPRAKGRPLSLYLFVDSIGGPMDDDDIAIGMIDYAEFFVSIYPWLQRVSHLALGSMWMTDIIDLLGNTYLPHLKRLTLLKASEEDIDSPDHDTIETLLESCPTLLELTVDHSFLSHNWYRCLAVCDTLTKLSMREFVCVLDAIQILSSCPMLEVCQLHLVSDWGDGMPAVSHHRKTHLLRKLRLEMSFPDVHAMDLLQHFSFPNLRSLKAHHDLLSHTNNDSSISSRGVYHPDGFPALRKLCIFGHWGFVSAAYYKLIQKTPSISHLRVHLADFKREDMHSFAEFMTWRTLPTLSRPLPMLALLELTLRDYGAYEWKVMIQNILWSRTGFPLETVRIYGFEQANRWTKPVIHYRSTPEIDHFCRMEGFLAGDSLRDPSFCGNPIDRKVIEPWYNTLKEPQRRRREQDESLESDSDG